MLIDGFTVGAQTLNFLILVWLMQRFLYKPILRAIDAREKRIALELAEAALKMEAAQNERDVFRKKNEELDRQRADLLAQMNDDVESERFRLLDEARAAADALSAKRMDALRSDARSLSQSISRRAQAEVFAITRKTLADLASASLEERMADAFVRQLRALSAADKEALKTTFDAAASTALVRSAFELLAPQRAAIERVIQDLVAAEVPVRFETAPDLVSGVDLTANGRKISWNIAAYLASLEKGVSELLDVKDKPERLAEPAAESGGSGTTSP